MPNVLSYYIYKQVAHVAYLDHLVLGQIMDANSFPPNASHELSCPTCTDNRDIGLPTLLTKKEA